MPLFVKLLPLNKYRMSNTKRFSSSNILSPRSTTENPIAISSEDRRLLLSKLFGGRTRTPLG
jgi:hypothetical protein